MKDRLINENARSYGAGKKAARQGFTEADESTRDPEGFEHEEAERNAGGFLRRGKASAYNPDVTK